MGRHIHDICRIPGNTALIHAAIKANDEAIEILLKSFRRLGLMVDHENNEGMTALLVAAKHGHVECATLLAQEGKASVTKRDRIRMMNAEEWAREQGCSTPEIICFSPFPNKSCIRSAKYYSKNVVRYDMDLAELYGHSIDDSNIRSHGSKDSIRSRSRTLPKQTSLPSTSSLTETAEESLEQDLSGFHFKGRGISEEGMEMSSPGSDSTETASPFSLDVPSQLENCSLGR